jgi:CheY-like chemotaxis protein
VRLPEKGRYYTWGKGMNRRPKILLVDDDADFVKANRALLENDGFEVVTASSGLEAFGKVRFEQPDLIVLDLMMERHDTGFTVARALKADPIYQRIPILMVSSAKEKTGYEFSQEMDGYWMKTDDYVAKPIEPVDLVARIRHLLGKARSAA